MTQLSGSNTLARMNDDKHEERETADELEIDDLDLDLDQSEAVKGGRGNQGGNYDNAEIGKVLK